MIGRPSGAAGRPTRSTRPGAPGGRSQRQSERRGAGEPGHGPDRSHGEPSDGPGYRRRWIGLHQLTGSSVWDAALLIGVLLSVVAYALGRTNRYLLIGRQADPRLVYAVRDRLAGEPEVVPRTDPELRARVLARYGDALSG